MSDRPILIIDFANLFIRSYAAYPQMSSHGYQMGGCVGFMKTLARLTREIGPSAIYIAWEGGGSTKRRAIYSEYKMQRKPEKLNRFYEDDIPESEDNKKHQMLALLGMLKCAPVCNLYVNDCEGDDVVAYLSRCVFPNVLKVIASSDKDMYQLLDDKTRVYNLHKKNFVTTNDIIEQFRVTAGNFAMAKALCGDPSDNIPGIKGLGFKTVAKLFPFLCLEEEIILDDVFKYCHTHLDESSIFKKVIDQEDDIRRNWRLVYLDGGMLSQHQAAVIDQQIANYHPKINKMQLVKSIIKEGINEFDVDGFLYSFNGIDNLVIG